MIKLDVKDRKIIRELELNARQPSTIIAKRVGLRPDIVLYRMKRLQKEGIIQNYLGYVNFHQVGYIDFGVYVNMKCLNLTKENQFVEYIKKHDQVSYFARTGGNYGFIIGVLAKSPISLHPLIKEITNRFGEIIDELEIVTRLSLNHFPRKYLIAMKESGEFPYFGGEINQNRIDKLDHSVLQILASDARTTATDIAEKLNKPISTIMMRINNLQKKKIITGYYTVIASYKFGYQSYNLLIKMKGFDKKDDELFTNYCRIHPHITWIIKTLGHWDYEIEIEVENQEKLQEIISEIRGISPKIMRIDFLTIFDTLKYSLYPFKHMI